MSVIDYVNAMRIAYACELLTETAKSITEVAMESGFSTLSHFNRQFRKLQRTTPTRFRKSARAVSISTH